MTTPKFASRSMWLISIYKAISAPLSGYKPGVWIHELLTNHKTKLVGWRQLKWRTSIPLVKIGDLFYGFVKMPVVVNLFGILAVGQRRGEIEVKTILNTQNKDSDDLPVGLILFFVVPK